MSSQSNVTYLKYQEAASIFGLSLGTLYSMVSKKQIPHVRLGKRFIRFSREELEIFFRARYVAPVEQKQRGE